MRIFLTGGSGFIGRNIIEHLAVDHDIFAPTHQELELTDTNAVYRYLEKHPVDIVIHSANIGGNRKQKNVNGILNINLKIFFNLIRSKRFFDRMITLGSGAEYDKKYPIIQIRESDFGNRIPSDEYGFYKYICSQYASGVEFITHLRLFSVIGKYEDAEIRFVSNTILKVLRKDPVEIYRNILFDYLSIEDFIRILNTIILKKPSRKFLNIGSGNGFDLKTIAKKIIQEVGIEVPILILNMGDWKEYTCNIDCLKMEMGAFSFNPIENSIAKMVAYFQ